MYRARDTKLDREVAIKVLPAAVAQAPRKIRPLRARSLCWLITRLTLRRLSMLGHCLCRPRCGNCKSLAEIKGRIARNPWHRRPVLRSTEKLLYGAVGQRENCEPEVG